jgi:hypothetical protein
MKNFFAVWLRLIAAIIVVVVFNDGFGRRAFG